jgi:Na+/H+ antiporter NhaD/arsenite permease-like protein
VNNNDIAKIAGFFCVITIIPFILSLILAPLNIAQVISLVIFTSFIAGSLFYWQFRNAFAFIGIALLLAFNVLDIEHLIAFAHLELILFLVGMMIIIAFLESRGVFNWLVTVLIKPFFEKPYVLIAILLMLGALMAALVDEVTSILFMSTIMFKVLDSYGVPGRNALPCIMFLVFTTNIGSSALPVGNPIGVMIAFGAGLTVMDFLRWTFPIAIVCSLIVTAIAILYLKQTTPISLQETSPNPIQNPKFEKLPLTREVKGGILIFGIVIAGLILQSNIEQFFGLGKNILLLGIPLIIAGFVLILDREHAHANVEKVDWYTLLFFLFLFAAVGSLQYVGITDKIAGLVTGTGGNLLMMMLLVGGIVSILTAFLDNVLAVATIMPVVQALAGTIPLEPVWWTMLIGGTYCGNATIIGSTANIVAAGMVEKKGLGSFSMLGWMKIGIPVAVLTFFIAFGLLYLQVMLLSV